jgi:agmatinase
MSDEGAYFLGYPSVDVADALFSLIPAPAEEAVSYQRGQAAAPRAILDASSQIEDYDEETGLSLVDMGVHILSPEEAPSEDEGLESWVKERVGEALDATTVPVILGGDGTVTLWGIEALLPRCDELSVLHIDANADMDEADDGAEDHHTVMRRVLELPKPPYICQVGVRSLSREAFNRIMDDQQPVETFFMSDLHRAEDESWHDDVIEELRSPVYLSIDLTGFDPSVIPAVGNPEPGGLGWWPVLRLIKKVAARRRIAAIDITELCPREGLIRSDFAAARLAYKIMNYIHLGGKMLVKEGAPDAAE